MRRTIQFTLLLLFVSSSALAGEGYLRLGGGWERTSDAIVRDRDCEVTTPPALFGCVDGNDGRVLAARGDFGDGVLIELALGTTFGERARVELAVGYRPSLDLTAEANFIGVAGEQPVRAGGRSVSAMVVGAFEPGPSHWLIRPFVVVGAGVSRNTTSAIEYRFPAIAADAVTITRGGTSTELAWTAGAGVSYVLSPGLTLDFAVQRTDLGDVRAEDGEATIIRPTRTLLLNVAGTRTALATVGATLSVRVRR